MSFGRELQQEREKRGLSIDEVAEATRFAAKHLRALESGDHAALPGGVFNKGIVRAYCRHLELDEEAWVTRFARLQGEAAPDWAEFAENVKRNRVTTTPQMRLRWWWVLLMLIVLAAAGFATWKYLVKPRLPHPAPTLPAADGPGLTR